MQCQKKTFKDQQQNQGTPLETAEAITFATGPWLLVLDVVAAAADELQGVAPAWGDNEKPGWTIPQL